MRTEPRHYLEAPPLLSPPQVARLLWMVFAHTLALHVTFKPLIRETMASHAQWERCEQHLLEFLQPPKSRTSEAVRQWYKDRLKVMFQNIAAPPGDHGVAVCLHAMRLRGCEEIVDQHGLRVSDQEVQHGLARVMLLDFFITACRVREYLCWILYTHGPRIARTMWSQGYISSGIIRDDWPRAGVDLWAKSLHMEPWMLTEDVLPTLTRAYLGENGVLRTNSMRPYGDYVHSDWNRFWS